MVLKDRFISTNHVLNFFEALKGIDWFYIFGLCLNWFLVFNKYIIFEEPLFDCAIWKPYPPFPILYIIRPLPLINSPIIIPFHDPKSLSLILFILPLILITTLPSESPMTMLQVLLIFSLIPTIIVGVICILIPGAFTLFFTLVVLTLIASSICID